MQGSNLRLLACEKRECHAKRSGRQLFTRGSTHKTLLLNGTLPVDPGLFAFSLGSLWLVFLPRLGRSATLRYPFRCHDFLAHTLGQRSRRCRVPNVFSSRL
jgi:hypothetical protein